MDVYFEPLIESVSHLKGVDVRNIFEIINARYRDKNYEINWLFFSSEEDPKKPDTGHLPDYVDIRDSDRLLNAGVSFLTHTLETVYPDPHYVLNQLPPHRKLVLDGFHNYDCVNRIARASYDRDVDTFVDEDTTDSFFLTKKLKGEIPLVREKWFLEDMGFRGLKIGWARKYREDKPWFVQR